MTKLIIRQLGPNDEMAFLAGLKAWEGEERDWHSFVWTEQMTHEAHLRRLLDDFRGVSLSSGRVPHTMLYGFLDGVIVGRCSVRHELNDFLRGFGGHLGYAVAPPFRGKGFGSQLFSAGRTHLKSLGVLRAFMTCGHDNRPSRKMIEDAGGIFQDEVVDPSDQRLTRRYWVPL